MQLPVGDLRPHDLVDDRDLGLGPRAPESDAGKHDGRLVVLDAPALQERLLEAHCGAGRREAVGLPAQPVGVVRGGHGPVELDASAGPERNLEARDRREAVGLDVEELAVVLGGDDPTLLDARGEGRLELGLLGPERLRRDLGRDQRGLDPEVVLDRRPAHLGQGDVPRRSGRHQGDQRLHALDRLVRIAGRIRARTLDQGPLRVDRRDRPEAPVEFVDALPVRLERRGTSEDRAGDQDEGDGRSHHDTCPAMSSEK